MKKLCTLLVAGAIVLTGCSSGGSKTLTVGCEKLTGTFSPLYYSGTYDGYVVSLVYNKLLGRDVDNQIVPELAKELPTVSEDGKVITFKLRDDVKFSDGSVFDAKDVKMTMEIVSDSSYDGRYSAQVSNLVGYKEYNDGSATEISGIKLIDDYTVEFTFVEGYRTNKIDVGEFPGIISDEQFKDYKQGDTASVKKLNAEPIGTGAYTLKNWDVAAGAAFEKNKEHYIKKGYSVDKVVIKPVNMANDYEELKSGSVDYVPQQIEPKKVGPASQNKDLALAEYARPGYGYIEFNTGNGATQSKEVRHALSYAFDRKSFVDSFFYSEEMGKSIGILPNVPMNPISFASGDKMEAAATQFNYDMEKAKQILDSAGWTVGADGKRADANGNKLEIKILSIADHDILSNLVPMWQKDWGDQLGATVQVATLDFNTVLDKISKDSGVGEWNVFFLATTFTGDDPYEGYSSFHSSQAIEGGDNYGRLKDPALDSILEQARTEIDEEKAKELYIEVAKIMTDDNLILPIYQNTYFDMYNKKVKNVKVNSLYDWTKALKDITID